MDKRKYLKIALLSIFGCVVLMLGVKVSLAEEEDFFPIALWAVWGGEEQYPQNQEQWDAARDWLRKIKANCLEGCIYHHEEEILDSLCDNRGYWVTGEEDPAFPNPGGRRLDKYWVEQWPLHHHEPDTSGWPDSVSAVVQRMYDTYGNHPGFYGYLVAHEIGTRDPFYYPGLDTVCRIIDSIDPNPNRKSIVYDMIWNVDSTFFDAVPSLDVFRHGSFPFRPGDPYSGPEFQARLDTAVSGYQMCFESFRGRHTKWYAHIQVGAWGQEHPHRRPSEWEIRVQAWLALSRGAKGISYFPYFSGGDPPGDFFHGLVTEETPRQPWHWFFDWVASLNQDLRVIGPIMRRLECTAAFSADSIPPASYMGSVDGSDYIEVGTFLDSMGIDYFMLVNRHCLPQDTVTLTVEIEKGGTWLCRDMLTGEDTVLVSDSLGKFCYTKVVGPGDGCLVLLKKAE